jgi:hypothetical protein
MASVTYDINTLSFPRTGESLSMFNTSSARMAVLAAIVLFIAACAPVSSTPLPAATGSNALQESTQGPESAQPLLKTEQGDFVIASARLVDEANGVKPQAGEKLLLVILTQPDLTNLDPDNFSLEAFSNMTHAPGTEIYILGEDGSQTISTMGGWVGNEFAMGFRVPVDVNTYALHWTGNSPISLHVEE